jgi:2'-hydroxyisoflavone reductase
MSTTRREFLRRSAATGTLLALSPLARAWQGKEEHAKAAPGLKLLILGGTGFLGPHIVEAAQKRGHTMTLFNRGKTHPGLFPDLEKLHGDRDGNLKALEGRQWDAVIDTSGYVPRIVKLSADLLKDAVKQYVFISTISVYPEDVKAGSDETAPVGKIPDETTEQVSGTSYGPLKALCEQAAEKSMPGRATTIRPGLIVGPGDETDRFTYWPVRIAKGGEVLAPGSGEDPVQFIDVRDLAAFTITAIEKKRMGVYNATGPAETLTMMDFLEDCKSSIGGDVELTWVPTEFLQTQRVQPWSDMPVWVPVSAGHMSEISVKKAVGAGLTYRPIAETVKDTLAWWQNEPKARQNLKTGLPAKREQDVLAAWHARESK